MLKDLPVHMLWVSGELSRLARLSLASFQARGYRTILWSYEPRNFASLEVERRDASAILPASQDAVENTAYLSSLFRYRLLARQGGIWSDMDVVALDANPAIAATALVASEKRRPFRHREATATGESLTQVTNCFMANPSPCAGDLWHRAADRVAALNPEERTWENVGPHMLSSLMLERPDHGVAILATGAVDPVAWWNVPAYFLEDRSPPPSPFMHMYASIWARRGVDAEAPFPDASLAGRLWRELAL
jgi:Glycosyltransferase sugar-binding region containing DXD motif